MRRSEMVSKLILVNGPPGVGKSTVARRYVDDHPMTLDLERDGIRAMIGSWLEAAERSGLAARRIALAVAVTHLRAGYDAIVPQLLARREFVDELRRAAESVGATFHEVTLVGDKTAVLERAALRPEPAGSFSARALVAKQGGSLEQSYDRFMEALAARSDPVVIDAATVEGAYTALVYYLNGAA